MIIGITGLSGAGKSTAAGILADLGAYVINADKIGHNVLDTSAFQRVIAHFGSGIIGADGKIDRRKLGRIVFDSPEELETLNAITHPLIYDGVIERLKGRAFAVLDAPLLFEAGLDKVCDMIIVVKARFENMSERIVMRDGITRGDAVKRLESRNAAHNYDDGAVIVYNDGNLDELRRQLEEIIFEGGKNDKKSN